ncbi:Ger(x)C family spore germination protein [Sporosarcina obsidiansis]|uniref:Ger(x)C family spore germination protein n=1 Tax=Sporosarcina obsidiansis TaxID=2660748 RepID=UPI00129B6955|nr:Ger(x)C family spore germination protein [Sporosarcina obsidiansis]
MKRHIFSILKPSVIVMLLFTLLLQTGCAFKDIDKRLFISAIGIDPPEKSDEGYKVTLKVALPFGAIKESAKSSYAYLTEEGESIGEIIRMLETHVDKVLEFGHMKTIVIHQDLMADNMDTFMDYFFRRGDIQLIAYVAGANPSAEDILRVEPQTEAPASLSLFNFFGDTATESPYIVTTFLFQFRKDLISDGINPVLPLVETTKEHDELVVNNAIVVGKQQEPVELSNMETKYYNSLFKGSSGFSYKVEHGDDRLLLNISRIDMDYEILTKNDVPKVIEMNVKMSGIVGESKHPLTLSKLDEYNQFSSEEVKRKIHSLLKNMQEKSVDPFGFGLRYRATRQYHEDIYRTWEKAYPDIEFKVNVEVKLQSTGTIE